MKRTFKPSDLKVLSDEQIASLTFATERFIDGMNEGDYNQSFKDEADKLAGSIGQEYRRRKLHFTMFQKGPSCENGLCRVEDGKTVHDTRCSEYGPGWC